MAKRFNEREFRRALAEAKSGPIKSCSALARLIGRSEGYSRMIASGLIPGPETREAIASLLGVPADAIWSDEA